MISQLKRQQYALQGLLINIQSTVGTGGYAKAMCSNAFRKDFLIWLYHPSEQQLLTHVVSLVKRLLQVPQQDSSRSTPIVGQNLWMKLQRLWHLL